MRTQFESDMIGIETEDEDICQVFRWNGAVLKGILSETSEIRAMRDAGFEEVSDMELVARVSQFVRDPQPDDRVLLLGDRELDMRVSGPVKRSPDGIHMTIQLRRDNAENIVTGGADGESVVMPDGMSVIMP